LAFLSATLARLEEEEAEVGRVKGEGAGVKREPL
jgi:hypothetical protein